MAVSNVYIASVLNNGGVFFYGEDTESMATFDVFRLAVHAAEDDNY